MSKSNEIPAHARKGHPTCPIAVKDDSAFGWAICGKPSVRDIGFITQVKVPDGTLQTVRYLCEDHKVATVVTDK